MLDFPPLTEVRPNYCPRDGTPLGNEIKANKMRRVCPTCGYIYGRDPRVIVCLLVGHNDDLLFVARNGSWSLPLYLYDEHIDPRAISSRYLQQETGVQVQTGEVIDTFSVKDDQSGDLLVLVFRGNLDAESSIKSDTLKFGNPLTMNDSSVDPITQLILRQLFKT
jgi:predicted NUDIX family NTP pyrophosphohydrolase